MLPLYQVENLETECHESALSNAKRIQRHKRAIRTGRTRNALERFIKAEIQSGASRGELNQEMFTVLHRTAE